MNTPIRRNGHGTSTRSKSLCQQASLCELKQAVIADYTAARAVLRFVEGPQIALLLLTIGGAAVIPLIIDIFAIQDLATNGVNSAAGVIKLVASGALNAVSVFIPKLSRRLGEVIRSFIDKELRLTRQISLIRSCNSMAAVYRVIVTSGVALVPAVKPISRNRRSGSPPAGGAN